MVVGICDRGFGPEQRAGWRPAWAELQALGRVAEQPLLAELRASAADYRRDLLVTAAIGVTAGVAGDSTVLDLLSRTGDRRIDRRRQLIILEQLALGPRRSGDPERLTTFALRSDLDPLQQVAACLALARFPDADVELPSRWYRSDDPGLAAASRLARSPEPDRRWTSWLRRADPEAQLVQRGRLLGSVARPFDAEAAKWLVSVLSRRGQGDGELRRAALLHLSRAADPERWLASGQLSLDVEDLPWLIGEPGFREALLREGLLQPLPDRLVGASRLRVALAFALECRPEDLRRAQERWRSDEAASVFCLGLAWRELTSPGSVEPAWMDAIPPRAERAWVAWALEDAETAPPFASEDRVLDAAFDAAREGRLSREAAAAAIEAALWRRGAHLAEARQEVEHRLLRDLLVAGSDHAAPVLGRRGGYLPEGLSRGDPAFEVAFELLLFHGESRIGPPAGSELR